MALNTCFIATPSVVFCNQCCAINGFPRAPLFCHSTCNIGDGNIVYRPTHSAPLITRAEPVFFSRWRHTTATAWSRRGSNTGGGKRSGAKGLRRHGSPRVARHSHLHAHRPSHRLPWRRPARQARILEGARRPGALQRPYVRCRRWRYAPFLPLYLHPTVESRIRPYGGFG